MAGGWLMAGRSAVNIAISSGSFAAIASPAEELDVTYCICASFRPRDYMVIMQVLSRSTSPTPAAIAHRNFNAHILWNRPTVSLASWGIQT
jgi:hypothetical protein